MHTSHFRNILKALLLPLFISTLIPSGFVLSQEGGGYYSRGRPQVVESCSDCKRKQEERCEKQCRVSSKKSFGECIEACSLKPCEQACSCTSCKRDAAGSCMKKCPQSSDGDELPNCLPSCISNKCEDKCSSGGTEEDRPQANW